MKVSVSTVLGGTWKYVCAIGYHWTKEKGPPFCGIGKCYVHVWRVNENLMQRGKIEV